MVGEKCFLEEISALDIQRVSMYQEKNEKNLQLGTNKIIRNYWKLIQKKAIILKTKKNIIYFDRSLRNDFLSSLTFDQVLKQIAEI